MATITPDFSYPSMHVFLLLLLEVGSAHFVQSIWLRVKVGLQDPITKIRKFQNGLMLGWLV